LGGGIDGDVSGQNIDDIETDHSLSEQVADVRLMHGVDPAGQQYKSYSHESTSV